MSGKPWSAEERQFLRRAVQEMTTTAIAERLGRTYPAVMCQVYAMRLRPRFVQHQVHTRRPSRYYVTSDDGMPPEVQADRVRRVDAYSADIAAGREIQWERPGA